MRVAGRFLPPTRGAIAALAGATRVSVVAAPGDPVPLHERLAALREALPGIAVEAGREAAGGDGQAAGGGGERDAGGGRIAEIDAVLDEGPETLRIDGAGGTGRSDRDGGAGESGGARTVEVRRVPGPAPCDVRADPMRHWDALPPALRPRYVRRLRLFGPESTGKSTAAAALAAHFGTVWVPEMSRPLYEAAGYRFAFDDVARVVAAQVEAEEAAARAATRVLVCDTDVLTTHLYSLHYFGRSPAVAAVLAAVRRYHATLLFNLDVPWEADPVRDSPAARAVLYGVFEAALRERGEAFTVVEGTGQSRLDAALRAAEAALDLSP